MVSRNLALVFLFGAIPQFSFSENFILNWKETERSKDEIHLQLSDNDLNEMLVKLSPDAEIIQTCTKGLWGGFLGYRVKSEANSKFWEISCGSIREASREMHCKSSLINSGLRNTVGWPVILRNVAGLDIAKIDYQSTLNVGGEHLALHSIKRNRPFDVEATYLGCHCRQIVNYHIQNLGKGPLSQGEVAQSICI